MAEHSCENCAWRARFEKRPESFLGRLWKWHAGWCPGWKSYMFSLPGEKRNKIARDYGMGKFIVH